MRRLELAATITDVISNLEGSHSDGRCRPQRAGRRRRRSSGSVSYVETRATTSSGRSWARPLKFFAVDAGWHGCTPSTSCASRSSFPSSLTIFAAVPGDCATALRPARHWQLSCAADLSQCMRSSPLRCHEPPTKPSHSAADQVRYFCDSDRRDGDLCPRRRSRRRRLSASPCAPVQFLSEAQLLSEGRRICDANHSGQNSYDSIVMVMNDLKVSGGVAQNIVITANIHLGC